MSGPPFSNFRKKWGVENAHPGASNFRNQMGFGKSSNSPNPNLVKQPLSWIVDINGKMDLEKLIWTPSISAQLPETFALSWTRPFENHVFRPQSQGAKILEFQTPPAPPADKLSNPDPGPSQRTQRWNTSAGETLAVDMTNVPWNTWTIKCRIFGSNIYGFTLLSAFNTTVNHPYAVDGGWSGFRLFPDLMVVWKIMQHVP